MEEKTFFEYEDVKVTNARFISGAQTYAMSNVTSVKNRVENPSRVLPILLLIVGIASVPSENYGFAGFAIVVGCLWLYLQKTTYYVMLSTSAGETNALKTHQLEYVTKVVNALNDAIVFRG